MGYRGRRVLSQLRASQPRGRQLLFLVRTRTRWRTATMPPSRSIPPTTPTPPTRRPDVTLVEVPARRGRARGHPGPQHRGSLPPGRHGGPGRPPPRERHLPRRHHGLAAPRRDHAQGRRRLLGCATSGSLNGTYVNRERIDEVAARTRRRGADRQVQAGLPGGWKRVSSRTYLSIGDVLTLLREEFPDVTISKIRFLESQGLVNPERSPVGLPQVLRARRRAPALGPAPAAGALPAPQGDPGPPGRR